MENTSKAKRATDVEIRVATCKDFFLIMINKVINKVEENKFYFSALSRKKKKSKIKVMIVNYCIIISKVLQKKKKRKKREKQRKG